jgi:hypothetical protein
VRASWLRMISVVGADVLVLVVFRDDIVLVLVIVWQQLFSSSCARARWQHFIDWKNRYDAFGSCYDVEEYEKRRSDSVLSEKVIASITNDTSTGSVLISAF